jgi:hypothetical protein
MRDQNALNNPPPSAGGKTGDSSVFRTPAKNARFAENQDFVSKIKDTGESDNDESSS